MKLAQISLNRYYVTELSFSTRADFDPDKPTEAKLEEFKVDTNMRPVEVEDIKDTWQLSLEVSQQSGPETNFPYEFRVEVLGLIQCIDPSVPEEDKERLVHVNGFSMLYGVARELIFSNTERGPWNGVIVPTVSFYEPKEAEVIKPDNELNLGNSEEE